MHKKKQGAASYGLLVLSVAVWLAAPVSAADVTTEDVVVAADRAKEEAKYESQATTIITKEDIAAKQAKSVEDIIFNETGVTRTVDAMGRVGVSIRGAEPRHTLILIDGQSVMGDFSKYYGAGDELQRIGTENVERIEIIQGAASAKYGSGAIGGVINVITSEPSKKPSFRFNAELRHGEGDGGFPYHNFYIRGDSGQMGKFRVSAYGVKREIMPVYASEPMDHTWSADFFGNEDMTDMKNSLRYYGDTADGGVSLVYDASKNNQLLFSADRYTEHLGRDVKHTDSPMEPIQKFKRDATRDTYRLAWKGRSGATDWDAELNYARMRENDIALTSLYSHSIYEGKNTLNYMDDIDHRQYDVKITANTQVNDRHLLTYGAGYTYEKGSGSRLKNAPNTYLRRIDPWDYDKSLAVDEKTGEPSSKVHEYLWRINDKGVPEWDYAYELYGYRKGENYRNGTETQPTEMPIFTKNDFDAVWEVNNVSSSALIADMSRFSRLQAFMDQLAKEEKNKGKDINILYAGGYYTGDTYLNGKKFNTEFDKRQNQQLVGEASIRKEQAFLQDTWQIGEYTTLSPILRLEHSNLFGSHVSAQLGLMHELGGNPHRRFKANIGTGYMEPGMGELYYNWEMYGSSPMGYDYEKNKEGFPVNKDGKVIDLSNFKDKNGKGITWNDLIDKNGHFIDWDTDERFKNEEKLKEDITTILGKEMIGGGKARMGWYWVGNPNLQPEKSFNVDFSVEGENKNTYAKATVFHNRIRDYMTVYFTGSLMDFSPDLSAGTKGGQDKWLFAPDMVYSFKNIGRAEITGIELDLEQKLSDRWKAKLGYTYLHAMNKSDPDMPDRLLDKPQHKIDLGLTWDDGAGGWSASVWGSWYIHMLDSNTLADGGNYLYSRVNPEVENGSIIDYKFADKKKQEYEEKTFSTWNMIVQKKLDKDSLIYVGVDNIFDHRDDGRAFGGRVYRFGVNLKCGFPSLHDLGKFVFLAQDKDFSPTDTMADTLSEQGDFFITKPFDEKKEPGAKIIGDYRTRWDSHGGVNRAAVTVTAETDATDAANNMIDPAEHGFGERLRIGIDGRIGKNTNLTVLGSASGLTSFDTFDTISPSKGLNRIRLDRLDWTQHARKWDFSFGRIYEPMGVTGYWFGGTYDGGRAVWTGNRSQVRIGYGDFSASTGIEDSPYTRATRETFYRAPTVEEFLGIKYEGVNYYETGEEVVEGAGDTVNFYQQLKKAKTAEEINAIAKHMWELMTKAYGNEGYSYEQKPGIDRVIIGASYYNLDDPFLFYTYRNSKGDEIRGAQGIKRLMGYIGSDPKNPLFVYFSNMELLEGDGSDYVEKVWNEHKDEWVAAYRDATKKIKEKLEKQGSTFLGWDSHNWEKDLHDSFIRENCTINSQLGSVTTDDLEEARANEIPVTRAAAKIFQNIEHRLHFHLDQQTELPREKLGKATGLVVKVTGTALKRDVIPPIDRAFFVQAKHEISPNFGVAAWYFRSTNDKEHSYASAHGDGNDIASFSQLANVFAVGAKWKIGNRASLSFDYGRNVSDFAKYMNGRTLYEHERGTSSFAFLGRERGSAPTFYAVRLDVGRADTDVPGSWNAFADYKYFEHGAFFGGNGTGAVPDRYLDGVKSFTVGGGYVPAKNFLVEAFYTFDAKGIGKRDTLYGSESFVLGDYARMQMKYRF